MMIFLVSLKMIDELVDPFRNDSHLDFRRARISRAELIVLNNF
jgi:hypothetical protein